MKMNFKSLVAGMFIASAGSLMASSTTLPFTFQAGEKAKAAEVNANFSTLTAAVNSLNTRTTTLESSAPAAPAGIDLAQVNAAVGSEVMIGGLPHIIKEESITDPFNNTTYKIKFPEYQSFASYPGYTGSFGGFSAYSVLTLRYPDQPAITLNELTTPYNMQNIYNSPYIRINNGANEFNVFLNEAVEIYRERDTIGNKFRLQAKMVIYLTDKLVISLYCDFGTNNAVATLADIEVRRKELRQALSYIVVTKS